MGKRVGNSNPLSRKQKYANSRDNLVHFPTGVQREARNARSRPVERGKLLAKILFRFLPVGRMPARLLAMRRAREPPPAILHLPIEQSANAKYIPRAQPFR